MGYRINFDKREEKMNKTPAEITVYNEKKAFLLLKLGHPVALVVGVGDFFESQTFDWIKLELLSDLYFRAVLIRSFHQGDRHFPYVLSFDTTNGMATGHDPVTNNYIEGTWEECLLWITESFHCPTDKFVKQESLELIYQYYCELGVLKHNLL